MVGKGVDYKLTSITVGLLISNGYYPSPSPLISCSEEFAYRANFNDGTYEPHLSIDSVVIVEEGV